MRHRRRYCRPWWVHKVCRSIALLYLVTEELLVGVRNVSETPWHTLVLFTGFILVFVIEMLVH